MRTLDSREIADVAGGVTTLQVDVNVPEKYVALNLVDGSKITTLIRIDWSKWFTHAPAPAA